MEISHKENSPFVEGHSVAGCYCTTPKRNAENDANGYLIAAAPEMYSILDAILKALETWDVGLSIRGLVLREMIEEVLKKA